MLSFNFDAVSSLLYVKDRFVFLILADFAEVIDRRKRLTYVQFS